MIARLALWILTLGHKPAEQRIHSLDDVLNDDVDV